MYSIYRIHTVTPTPSIEDRIPVLKFCKEHSIECAYDYNIRQNRAWTEVYYEGCTVLQVGSNASVEQFIQLIQNMYDTIMHNKFKNLDVAVASVDGPDFEVGFEEYEEDEELFKKLIEKHYLVFYNQKA